jgi:hypothetical protein
MQSRSNLLYPTVMGSPAPVRAVCVSAAGYGSTTRASAMLAINLNWVLLCLNPCCLNESMLADFFPDLDRPLGRDTGCRPLESFVQVLFKSLRSTLSSSIPIQMLPWHSVVSQYRSSLRVAGRTEMRYVPGAFRLDYVRCGGLPLCLHSRNRTDHASADPAARCWWVFT